MPRSNFLARNSGRQFAAVTALAISGGVLVISGYVSTIAFLWIFGIPYVGRPTYPPDWTLLLCCGAPHLVLGMVGIVLGLEARQGRLHPAGLGLVGMFAIPAAFALGGIPTLFGGLALLVAGVLATVENQRFSTREGEQLRPHVSGAEGEKV